MQSSAQLILFCLLPDVAAAGRLWRGGGPVSFATRTSALDTVRLSTALDARTRRAAAPPSVSCGPLATYLHARPRSYEDARATKYDAEAKALVKVTFAAGDTVEFECEPGYTRDGAKGGNTTFEVLCDELGYYKPSGVCLKASLCGPVPNLTHAGPTGKTTGDAVEFACSPGYSLDGNQVVPGGLQKNRIFTLKCIEFSGNYEAFQGECKPYAFMPATESVRIYNQVFEALFVVSCKGTLRKAFGAGAPPKGLDAACNSIKDGSLRAECTGLVTQIKADFEKEKAAREAHDKKAKKDWYEAKEPDRPGIGDEALAFCTKLWALLELPG